MGKLAYAAGLCVLLLSGCQPAIKDSNNDFTIDANAKVQQMMLPNGMKVLVQENHRAPVVVSQVWYKVGGSYEHDGITGLSHALEHMMFKGTKKIKAGQFSEIIAANGGSENAFTSKDYTAYFQRIASDRLELCLKLEADRMRNLVIKEDEFKKEIEVIKEERRMRTEDKPTSLSYEYFNATAYVNSPYHQPIIGWMNDLDNMQVADLRRWYQTWYAPNNATLVVAGDVKAADVFKLAQTYFGPLKPSEIPALKPRLEVPQYGERRITIKRPAKVPYLVMGYKVPVLKTAEKEWEVYALEMLAGILDGGDSSRLTRELVRGQQIAAQAGASYDMYAKYSNLFVLDAVPIGEHSVKDVEQGLLKQLQKIQQQAPSEAEMQRVKAQVMAAAVYEQDSVFYQAMQLGTLETVGLSWQEKEKYMQKIKQVTAEQVQAVAKKYLQPETLTVAVLEPQKINSSVQTGGHKNAH